MDDGGVVATAKLLSYRRVRNTEFLAQHVHDYLPRLHDLFLTGLLVDALFRHLVVAGDSAHDFVDGDALVGSHIVLDERAHVGLCDTLSLQLRLAHDHVEDPLELADIPADVFGDVLDDIVRYREPVCLYLGSNDGNSRLHVGLGNFGYHAAGEASLQALLEPRRSIGGLSDEN